MMSIRSAGLGVSLAAVVASTLGGGALAASPLPSDAPASPIPSPAFDPADFRATVDNPWFPLVPGTTLTYKGSSDGGPSTDVFEVTHDTAVIAGVPVTVVHDSVYEAGKKVEETTDWYTQDRDGNVWYFGEDTRTFDANGNVESTEGSWRAGVDGAQPGIFMPAEPAIGQSFQQEFYTGHAEDWFVIRLMGQGKPMKVPYGSYPDALVTAEWTPLEPEVLSEKVYAKGVGLISESDVKGGKDRFELVSVETG
jgi:hypothetical protein